MTRRLIPALSLVFMIGAVSLGQMNIPSDSCDYVERFHIENRPAQIEESDVKWLENLAGIGPTDAGRISDYIEQNGPITSVFQLDTIDNIGEEKVRTIGIFFDLFGVGDCLQEDGE